MEVLQNHPPGQLGLALGPRAEGVRDFLDFRSAKFRENLQENFETLSVQLLFYFREILAPNQEVARHRIFQSEAQEQLRRLGGDPGLDSAQPAPFSHAPAINMAAAHDDIRAL